MKEKWNDFERVSLYFFKSWYSWQGPFTKSMKYPEITGAKHQRDKISKKQSMRRIFSQWELFDRMFQRLYVPLGHLLSLLPLCGVALHFAYEDWPQVAGGLETLEKCAEKNIKLHKNMNPFHLKAVLFLGFWHLRTGFQIQDLQSLGRWWNGDGYHVMPTILLCNQQGATGCKWCGKLLGVFAMT